MVLCRFAALRRARKRRSVSFADAREAIKNHHAERTTDGSSITAVDNRCRRRPIGFARRTLSDRLHRGPLSLAIYRSHSAVRRWVTFFSPVGDSTTADRRRPMPYRRATAFAPPAAGGDYRERFSNLAGRTLGYLPTPRAAFADLKLFDFVAGLHRCHQPTGAFAAAGPGL